jgi:small ligand-binding sensory domain FIST
VEYVDEPALVLMLLDLPTEHFRLFNGTRPLPPITDTAQAGTLGSRQWTALVHADPETPDLGALLPELAQRTGAGFLFGGLVSGREATAQLADGVFHGGLSGVAFHQDVPMLSRVTQGCQPIGPRRRITACERNVVLGLDAEAALPALMADLVIDREDLRVPPGRAALSPAVMQRLRATLVGLSADDDEAWDHAPGLPRGQFGDDTWVRHLIGLDPARDGVALADAVEPGMWMTFCRRDAEAARRDLLRICAEIREDLTTEETIPVDAESGRPAQWHFAPSQEIAGAVYVSCVGRGGPHFGGDSAELQWVRHALGDVPLVGLFASGEIAHDRLHGYTGVLTVFLREAP